uniref:Type III restriction enzyme n=1 Tax=Candidatus Kentrum sp. FM TaxID=2126340 RepID=A0A450SQH8_9GAMM|nr:MAG: type III restriction enzyme [Candidatus Kentron sp. FM]VFJ56260.1 MAG: type III restriction enzyme [Candidatus Kentron sp. FM]VFK10749.1 MAG: type III restriction enzyme [Candidatus Kentron sp. FM]
MKIGLLDFQETALAELRAKLKQARDVASVEDPQALSFSAPTGAGKTIVMTALFENILFGAGGFGEPEFEPQPDAVILWISDMPELNEQTLRKILHTSERIPFGRLVTVQSWFDRERLPGGHIFFMNTQKLGSDKLLTKKGDGRQYSLWETLTNTARAIPDRFYVIIDEAHRGMRRSGKEEKKARTILQRFLLGSTEDGLCRMPLVVGVSATPQRFENLLFGTTHTVYKVHVPPDAVRESGLLKDRISIHYPETPSRIQMALLGEAARRWRSVENGWGAYCKAEGEAPVRAILVIQVEDGTGKTLTKTDLATCLNTLEEAIGRSLKEDEVAHTFNGQGDLLIGDRRVRYRETSRIQEDEAIGVVLFKMALSTGWDCPRAEVMMSFRRAQDHTYVAQLLGRMVRTPLARRVERDAALNDVHLFLPHYDRETVGAVIEDLQNGEEVPPAEVGDSREQVVLHRRKGTEEVFAAMGELVTYRVDAARKRSALHRLMGLGRGLTWDRVDGAALADVKQKIVEKMAHEAGRLRDRGMLAVRAGELTGADVKTLALDRETGAAQEKAEYRVEAASVDIDRHFQRAGRLLDGGEGLHKAYWRFRVEHGADIQEAKREVVVLAKDHEAMRRLEAFAEKEFDVRYEKYRPDIGKLREARRKDYEKLRLASGVPRDIPWCLPENIAFRRAPKAPEYERHLYLEEDGGFRAALGTWERGVLAEELADPQVIGWLRNLDRKDWSLEIPYRDAGTVKPMFPGLVVVRRDHKALLFDILEPHDPSRADNAAKAVGLAEFAEKHGRSFHRIQLIREGEGSDDKERYLRLDVGNDAVRKKVLAVEGNSGLDRLFQEKALTIHQE